ncbi:MAG TPA: cytochrome D1 domain-containing protein [Terriglobia bacterium]|nr:cytochrome D1 domain-containing protein [Terriglobia bacterium]
MKTRSHKLLVALLVTLSLAFVSAGQVRIVQTNSGSGNIHLIDPATNMIVGEITGVPINHGAAGSPDGKRLYFSSEAEQVLAVADAKTLQITNKIKLSARPNNVSISKDGKKVYVGIISEPGGVDVVDTEKMERVKTLPTKGGIHNLYVTPDGKYLVTGSIAGKLLTVFDVKTEQVAWTFFNEGVRPITFDWNADGSTRNMYVNVNNYHGFVVVDFANRKELKRIELPSIPVEQRAKSPSNFNNAPSHGLGVTPDGKMLWVTSRLNHAAYAYSVPDLKYLGGVDVGADPDWVTFSPDSKQVYVACADDDAVSVIDAVALKEKTRIKVGAGPKRNITVMLKP